MAPEHKTLLVDCLKEEKFTVCMCGDGANDCGALKSADVGVSLSLEEASIAAHFTSNIPDISCLIKLLREGKGSLVTSIQCFKYMMLYSIIQFLAITLMSVFNTYLADNQFLICDLGIIFPLAILIARTGAYEKLTYHQPTGALISFPIVASILVQTTIQFICQYGIYIILSVMPWFYPNERSIDDDNNVIPCFANSAIFLVSNFQYIVTAMVFSISRPFKKPIYSNFLLTGFLILIIAYQVYVTIRPDKYSFDIFALITFGDDNFKFYIIFMCLANFILSYLVEKLLIPCLSEAWKRNKIRKMQNQIDDIRNTSMNLNKMYMIKVNI